MDLTTTPRTHVNVSSTTTSELKLGPLSVNGFGGTMVSTFHVDPDPATSTTIQADSFEHALVGAQYLVDDAARANQFERPNDSPMAAALSQAADGSWLLSDPQRLITIGQKPSTWWADDRLDIDVSVSNATPDVRAILVSGIDPTVVTDGSGTSHTTFD